MSARNSVSGLLDFKGQTALVTGAASGIGRASALAFAAAGARVVLADIDEAAGEAAAAAIRAAGGEAAFVRTDVTESADVARMVETAVERFGRLDIAFNNAGVEGKRGVPAGELDEADWARVIGVNLTSVWLCMKHELQAMTTRGGGVIVNASSTAGLVAAANSGVAYAASKHGVLGLTKTAAKEYLPRGVRINAICPGAVATPLLERTIGAEAVEAAKSGTSGARIPNPEEVAEAVLWLASPASAFVVGQALTVDGGRLL